MQACVLDLASSRISALHVPALVRHCRPVGATISIAGTEASAHAASGAC